MLGGLVWLGLLAGCERIPERPNLVLITLDTTRADHLATFGYHRDTSRTLDALAAESIVFENLMVPVATTLPSHTTLLTGTDPLEHGVVANLKHGGQQFQPSPSLRTLTQYLKDEGYHTSAFISATPLRAGTGVDLGFDTYDVPEKGSREAQLTSRRVEKWVAELEEQPFFLWVHYFDPHGPFEPPKRHSKGYKRDDSIQDWLTQRGIGETSERPTGQVLDSVEATNLYDGEIRYMDQQLGRVFDALRAKGLWDETVVVVVGDHGEGLGQHGMAGHGGVWREQLHAPFLIRSPWETPRRISRPVGMADVVPTVLGLVRIPGVDGMLAQASGVDALKQPPRPLYHHSSARQLDFGRVQDALTVGSWRFVRDEDGIDRMFHLDADPFEHHPLGSVLPVHAELLHQWTVAERERLTARGEALGRGAPIDLDPDQIEQLRQLGYVDDDEDAAEPPSESGTVPEPDANEPGDP